MKEGWKYEQMGNVCTFISGYTPAKELLSKSGSIPYYKVSDMNTEGNEVLLNKTSLYLSNAKKIIPKGSVVFPKNGGAIFTNKKRMLVCDSVVDLNTEAIFPNKNIITTNFLYKLLLSIDLGQFDNGGGLPSINIKKMQSFTIPIPPLFEQERIVSLLDAEFAKIDAIKANAEKQLQDAKALFQSALKDYLTLKEGWKYEQMGNVCTFISGYTPAKELLSKSGSIPYYKVSDMNTEGNEVLLNKTSLYLSNAKKIIPKGSVVFPKNGGAIFTNKKRMLVCDSVVDLNTEAIFPNKNIVTTNFLYKLLLSIDLGQFDNGGGLPSINIKKMQSFTIPIPPLSEQERIVSLLDGLSAKIQSLQSNFDTTVTLCNDLKQSILKDIFG